MANKPVKTTRSAKQRAAEEGPRYLLLEDSFINDQLRKAGTEVTYYGLPGSKLQAINGLAKERKIAVRDIRRDPDLTADQKLAKFKELSDEWNGVEDVDAFLDSEANLDGDDADDTGRPPNPRNTAPLPAAQRAELEQHAKATAEATKLEDEDNSNAVKLQLQGDPSDPKGKQNPASLQANTPVLDKGKAK